PALLTELAPTGSIRLQASEELLEWQLEFRQHVTAIQGVAFGELAIIPRRGVNRRGALPGATGLFFLPGALANKANRGPAHGLPLTHFRPIVQNLLFRPTGTEES